MSETKLTPAMQALFRAREAIVACSARFDLGVSEPALVESIRAVDDLIREYNTRPDDAPPLEEIGQLVREMDTHIEALYPRVGALEEVPSVKHSDEVFGRIARLEREEKESSRIATGALDRIANLESRPGDQGHEKRLYDLEAWALETKDLEERLTILEGLEDDEAQETKDLDERLTLLEGLEDDDLEYRVGEVEASLEGVSIENEGRLDDLDAQAKEATARIDALVLMMSDLTRERESFQAHINERFNRHANHIANLEARPGDQDLADGQEEWENHERRLQAVEAQAGTWLKRADALDANTWAKDSRVEALEARVQELQRKVKEADECLEAHAVSLAAIDGQLETVGDLEHRVWGMEISRVQPAQVQDKAKEPTWHYPGTPEQGRELVAEGWRLSNRMIFWIDDSLRNRRHPEDEVQEMRRISAWLRIALNGCSQILDGGYQQTNAANPLAYAAESIEDIGKQLPEFIDERENVIQIMGAPVPSTLRSLGKKMEEIARSIREFAGIDGK